MLTIELAGGTRLALFFSSRRRHTRFDCDWSSDVCSSDLIGPDELDGEERTDSSRRNRGEDGDGMNETLIEDAENDIDGGESGDDQDRLIGQRILKGLGSALKRSVNGIGHADFAASQLDVLDSGTERSARREIEGKSNGREDALVVDGKRGVGRLVVCEGAERNEFAGFGGHVN